MADETDLVRAEEEELLLKERGCVGQMAAGRASARGSGGKGLERSRRNMVRNWTETVLGR